MTGFRLARGGAQELYGVRPDLTTLGKIIGGGLPVGAYGGRRDLMEQVAPGGPVYQAGTLSGNPLAMAAGLAQLRLLDATRPLRPARGARRRSRRACGRPSPRRGVAGTVQRVGSLFCLYFTAGRVADWDAAASATASASRRFFHAMLERGDLPRALAVRGGASCRAAHTDGGRRPDERGARRRGAGGGADSAHAVHAPRDTGATLPARGAGEPVDRTPIWIMRQAGRYLPEYRAVRARARLPRRCAAPPSWPPRSRCSRSRRFALDAAILFSDILMPLDGHGHRG